MSGHLNTSQPITQASFDALQERAKADARRAIDTGDASRLTAVARAYYEKFRKESC